MLGVVIEIVELVLSATQVEQSTDHEFRDTAETARVEAEEPVAKLASFHGVESYRQFGCVRHPATQVVRFHDGLKPSCDADIKTHEQCNERLDS